MSRKPRPVALPEPVTGPPPLPPGFPRWKHFAWDGWDLEVPVDWDLGALEIGRAGEGYFRLDDEFEPRLTAKWKPADGRFDPDRAVDDYLRKQVKALGKAGLTPEVRKGQPLPGGKHLLKEARYQSYALEVAGRRSIGVAAHCPQCRRSFALSINVAGGGGGEGDRLVQRIMQSLRDHPEPGKALARWELYGLSAQLPVELRAAAHKLTQGFVSFAAFAPPRTRVELGRWSLAGMHLAAVSLRQFAARHVTRKRGAPPMTLEEATVQSHPGIVFASRRRLLEPVRRGVRRLLRARKPPYQTGLLWHCAPTNRIFMLTLGGERHADLGAARLLASRVRCCKVIY